jgi:hypothetical protein
MLVCCLQAAPACNQNVFYVGRILFQSCSSTGTILQLKNFLKYSKLHPQRTGSSPKAAHSSVEKITIKRIHRLALLNGPCHEIFYLWCFSSNNSIWAPDTQGKVFSYIASYRYRYLFAERFDFDLYFTIIFFAQML